MGAGPGAAAERLTSIYEPSHGVELARNALDTSVHRYPIRPPSALHPPVSRLSMVLPVSSEGEICLAPAAVETVYGWFRVSDMHKLRCVWI